MQQEIVYFDIAAFIVYLVVLLTVIVRNLTKGTANRIFIATQLLFIATCICSLIEGCYDSYVAVHFTRPDGMLDPSFSPPWWMSLASLCYYALRQLAAPAYLAFIIVTTSTEHLLYQRNLSFTKILIPCFATEALILTNSLTHLIFTFDAYGSHRAPFIFLIYLSALIYAIAGFAHLIRWRKAVTRGQFIALMSLYPLNAVAVLIQLVFPSLYVEMFATAIASLLIVAIVQRPEHQLDPLSGAGSYAAFADAVDTSFITGKPLSLTFLEITNYDSILRLIGKGPYHDTLRALSSKLQGLFTYADHTELYYLRTGMYCCISSSLDEIHERERAESLLEVLTGEHLAGGVVLAIEARAATVRTPSDVHDMHTLQQFVSNISRLLPQNRTVSSFSELAKDGQFRLKLELDQVINRGIANGSFQMWLQPIYDVKSQTFRSAEALIRLIDEEHGFVSPGLFIPEAEKNGSIEAIGNFVLEETLRFEKEADLASLGVDYLELNLSVDQCMRGDLADHVASISSSLSLDPGRINLELTETAASYAEDTVDTNVRRLSNLGFSLSLDDYGTGYSNPARLMKLPFDIVKIDKSLVDGIGGPSMNLLLASTIEVMHDIGKTVLAEGVESERQAEALIEMEIDHIQGYHYARPMNQTDFLAFIRSHNTPRPVPVGDAAKADD